jgi:hypothetical protein
MLPTTRKFVKTSQHMVMHHHMTRTAQHLHGQAHPYALAVRITLQSAAAKAGQGASASGKDSGGGSTQLPSINKTHKQ